MNTYCGRVFIVLCVCRILIRIINVLLVVIRYFGGVKLGAGGLNRAYGQMAKQVIDASVLQPL